ncbi:MAG: methyltransferase domain-containing protein [Acidobacteriaceae bacterium]
MEAFAGVSNVSLFAEIPEEAIVLDLGCGAGLDSLIAARRAGSSGKVIGVDFSGPMLDRARQAALEAAVEMANHGRVRAGIDAFQRHCKSLFSRQSELWRGTPSSRIVPCTPGNHSGRGHDST